jgi:hypothetical protein
MARRISKEDPALSIDFFNSGFYTHRSQLFAPFKGIGVNVVSFHDPVIDGSNMEDTDLYEWQRRPGFSIFCPIPLPDNEIVRQFYSSRNLNGTVLPFVDTSARLALFSNTSLTTILNKTTTDQGYISTLGNMTYFSDGAAVDYYKWDCNNLSVWGLAAPTIAPTSRSIALGFWQPFTTFDIGDPIVDLNGNTEVVTAILIPNGGFESPTDASTLALGGSLSGTWALDSVHGGFIFPDGYRHIQQGQGFTNGSTVGGGFPSPVTSGNTLVVQFSVETTNFIPTVISVTDSLGNVYTQQSTHTGFFAGGGGNNFHLTEWVWTAPVSIGGSCTVQVQTSAGPLQVTVHEFSGISGTETTDASNFAVHPATLNSGTVTFSGTQLVMSSILEGGSIAPSSPPTRPLGYTAGTSANGQLFDAYAGETSPQSPTWSTPAVTSGGFALGTTTVLPISVLATGYTPYLFLESFNFGIPAGATIVGIVVNIPKFNASGAGVIQDQSVKLVVGGSVAGSAERAAIGAWSNAGYVTTTYGSPIDTWGFGVGGITPAQANANGLSGFGVAISANVTSTTGGSVIPEVGFTAPNKPTVTIYFQDANGFSGPGVSGKNEPIWPTDINSVVNDGGLTWTNYGPIQAWFPTTGYPTPIIILDTNGNLQLATHVNNPIAPWNSGTAYTNGQVVYFGGQYWISVFNGANTNHVPSVLFETTSGSANQPAWSLTTTPLVTGLIAPVWNTTLGGTTVDGSYTWTNIGQGTGLAFVGYAYVYGYRTIYGHLTTSSDFSNNTGAILGPLNATITAFTIIDAHTVNFEGNNNFLPGNIFQVNGLSSTVGMPLNELSFTVISANPSSTFPLTSVQVSSNVLIIQAINNLVVGQMVTFSGVGTATFLNGITVTVIATGLSGTQFEANFIHVNYGPTADSGNVILNGDYTASTTATLTPAVRQLDSGVAIPLISTIAGVGTGSPLCNSVATITAVSVTADIVTVTASNNFQPGLWVTFSGLTGASFLNNQQLQVISVDQPVGTQNTQFQVFFLTPNYIQTSDNGTATFNAVEIYRTSDGGGLYLFDGAVTNPGAGIVWTFNDFVIDADLDVLLIAPLSHQNDPPPGAPGSLVLKIGTTTAYWQGRLWMIVGNYVYFDAGPDCTNGVPEESWPPANRFQYSGPVLSLEPTADGGGLLVHLADRVRVILGGPETISFYSMDALDNFGISNPNAIFKDGSITGQFTTQNQYIELAGAQKNDVGEHIGDYLAAHFDSKKTYVTMHRDGLDVGVFLSNGVDRIVRYGSNIQAWSVPAFPAFGAGALRSVETSVGTYSLMAASPNGGTTITTPLTNPISGTSVGTGFVWTNPGNITAGNPTSYATVSFTSMGSSQTLRAAFQLLNIPRTAIVQGVQVFVTGKQTDTSAALTSTITPTNPAVGAETHTFAFGTSNTTVAFGSTTDLWGMDWSIPGVLNAGALSFDIVGTSTEGPTPIISVSEVQVQVTYQNPGNYLYARDLNSWGDGGEYGENNGLPYSDCFITIGSITLSQLGAPLFPLQHVCLYCDAVGTLQNGGSSYPDVWILPNEVNASAGIGFIQLPEILQEPPTGQNQPSATILALRYPVNMMNSYLASQFIHHLQVRIEFQQELAPNTIKAISFKELQD